MDFILHKTGSDVELNQMNPFRAVTSLKLSGLWQEGATLTLTIVSATALTFEMCDWLTYEGEVYQVFTNYREAKLVGDRYNYTITLYSPERWLKRANMYNTSEVLEGSAYSWFRVDNELVSNGDIVSLGNQLCYNLNASQGRRVFKLGTYPAALVGVYKEFTFSDPNCLVCLHEICEKLGTFYKTRRNTAGDTDYILDFGGDEVYFPVTLKYGKKQGLYKMELRNADEEVYTQFVIQGSTKNLPYDYPTKRLSLDSVEYPDSTIYKTDEYARWGRNVKELTYDDIMPERVGSVTSILEDRNSFIDAELTFSPVGGNIKFLSGSLLGHTLVCTAYDEDTHKVTLKPYEDSNGFVIPSEALAYRIAVGDKYNIDGISLPASYVTDAETRLKTASLVDVAKYSQVRAEYEVRIEQELIESEGVTPVLGMLFHVENEEFEIDKFIRLTKITQNIIGSKPRYEEFVVSDLDNLKVDVKMFKQTVQAPILVKKKSKESDLLAQKYAEIAITAAANDATSKTDAAKDAFAQKLGYTSWDAMFAAAALGGNLITSEGLISAEVIDVGALAADNAFVEDLTVRFLQTVYDAYDCRVNIRNTTDTEENGASYVKLENSNGGTAGFEYDTRVGEPVAKVTQAGKNTVVYSDGLLSQLLSSSSYGYDQWLGISALGMVVAQGVYPTSTTTRIAIGFNVSTGLVQLYFNDLPRGAFGTAPGRHLYRSPDGLSNDIIRYQSP